MKSNAPWSVKGIERDARETAKEAAKREGMTVGEWLNQMIYSAGEAQETDGEIEGLKVRDLVTAIEHLNKRLGEADEASASAISDLSRNVGNVVERVQRLERVKPAEGTNEDLAQRVAKIETSTGDRQRVNALKALEKAVGQVAIQFNTQHKTSLERIEANERQLQELALRLDSGAGGGDADVTAVSYLKDAIDGLSSRITRAERIASEAQKLHGDAGGSMDPEFVERTGARLRVLGEEIKRGGDQIGALEATIGKLSEQIEAAERRSSEGVQKVAETITELREQFSQAGSHDADDQRAEIDAVVADASRETDAKITALQNSFDDMISRLETLDANDAVASLADDDGSAVTSSAAPTTVEPAEQPAAIEAEAAEEETEHFGSDDFNFELDDDTALDPQAADGSEAESLLSEVQEVFGNKEASDNAPPPEDAATPETRDDEMTQEPPQGSSDDELDAILADLDNMTSDDAPTPESGESSLAKAGAKAMRAAELPTIEKDAPLEDTASADEPQGDYLSKARQAAKQAAERAAEENQPKKRRNLTPKQKAILAARARRKKLETAGSEGAAANAETVKAKAKAQAQQEPSIVGPDVVESLDDDEVDAKSGPLAKLTGALGALRGRFAKTKTEGNEIEAPATEDAAAAVDESSEDTGGNADRAAFENLKANTSAKPVTLALGVAIVLAIAALFFLVKDLVFKSPEQITQPPVASTDAGTGLRDEDSLAQVPAAPTINPRDLYMEAMAALNGANSEEATAAAIKQLSEAAALGHPPAQLQLGELYKLGQGVEQDLGQARTWFRRAANGGNVLAMHRVGVMTARGDGGLADTEEAVGWFEVAANRGLVDSQYNLGAIFHPSNDGSASPIQDAGKAYFWYSLASKNGDEQAAPLAAGVAATLTKLQRQEVDATIAAWKAEPADPVANELAPSS